MRPENIAKLIEAITEVSEESGVDVPKNIIGKLEGIKSALDDAKHFGSIDKHLHSAIDDVEDDGALKACLIMLAVQNVKLGHRVDDLETQAGIRAKNSQRQVDTLEKKVGELEQLYHISATRLNQHFDEIVILQKEIGISKTPHMGGGQ